MSSDASIPIPVPHTNDFLDITFAPGGDTLYAAANAELVNLWAILFFHWPEFIALLLTLILLAVLVRTISVLRRPRRVGRLYCRRCNYDVTDQPETCPECGRPPASTPPRRGRSLTRRLAVPAAIAFLAIILSLQPLLFGLTRTSPTLANRFHWYSTDAVTWIRDRNLTRYQQFIRSGTELLAIDPVTRQWRRITFLDDTFAVGLELDLAISPDGRWTTLTADGHRTLVAIDLQTGKTIAHHTNGQLQRARLEWTWIGGHSDDSTTVYAAWHDHAARRVELVAWNPFTDTATTLHTVDSEVFPQPNLDMLSPFCWIPLPAADGAPRFLRFPAQYGQLDRTINRRPTPLDITSAAGDTLETFGANLNAMCTPIVRTDGAIIFLAGQPATPHIRMPGQSPERLRLQPPSGIARSTLQQLRLSHDETRLLAQGHRTLHLWDTDTGRLLGAAPLADHTISDITLSRDGRYAALITLTQRPAGGYDNHLRIVDFSAEAWWPDGKTP